MFELRLEERRDYDKMKRRREVSDLDHLHYDKSPETRKEMDSLHWKNILKSSSANDHIYRMVKERCSNI